MINIADDYILINGVSSDTVDIHIDTPPAPPMAQQRYTTTYTGADEDQTVPDDTFEDMQYTIDFYSFFPESYDNSAIYAFFNGAKTLQVSRLPGYYFKVRKVALSQPRVVADGKRIDYSATFTLAPFKYKDNTEFISVASGDTVVNSGTRYAKPIYSFTINPIYKHYLNDIVLTVNGVDFQIKSVDLGDSGSYDNEVVVDCERYIVYIGDKIYTYKSYGQFPFLAVGDNVIEYDDNKFTLKIRKNERCY